MPEHRGYLLQRLQLSPIVLAALLGLTLLDCTLQSAFAASSTAEKSPAVPLEWQAVSGKALDISIDAEGEAYATDAAGHVWHWRPDGQRWGPMSGTFVRIVGAGGNRPWSIDEKGDIFRYNGLWWEKKGEGGADVAADTKGNVLVTDVEGGVRRWNPLRSEWMPVPEAGKAVRVAISPDSMPWIIDKQGHVLFFDGTQWRSPAGKVRARDLAADSDRRGWVVTLDGRLLTWEPDRARWRVVALPEGRLSESVAIAPDGKPWVVLRGGEIIAATRLGPPLDVKNDKDPKATVPHAATPHAAPVRAPHQQAAQITAPPAVAPPAVATPVVSAPVLPTRPATPPNAGRTTYIDTTEVTASGPLVFTDTMATAGTVAIGRDGSVFALSPGGDVMRWSNTMQRLKPFPGTLTRLAVDGDGAPWGISALGRIFQHDGQRWKQLTGTASDIGIGADGTVITADSAGALYRLSASGLSFSRMRGSGVIVAVDPDGYPWTIADDGYVRRCRTSPCTRIGQKAISIAVGPDRSVYVVSDSNVLMHFNATTEKFERMNIPRYTPKQVAVGPSGYPWVVTTDNKLLSTHMFQRNETGDIRVSRSTSGNTTGSGETAAVTSSSAVSGFKFTKNMRFSEYNAFDGNVKKVGVGVDGTVLEWYIATNILLQTYNDKKDAFEEYDYNNATTKANHSFDTDSAGNLWAINSTSTTKVYKMVKGTLTNTYTPTLKSSLTSVDPEVFVDADDTVWILAYDGYVYYKKSASNSFTRFNQTTQAKFLAIGQGGDVWIADSSSYVKQWTGSAFTFRPASKQKILDIGAGTDGTVYICGDDNKLYKWNGTNKDFDEVKPVGYDSTTFSCNAVDVTPDGRPWVTDTSSAKIFRAKD